MIYGDEEDSMTDDGERTIAASSPIRGHRHDSPDAADASDEVRYRLWRVLMCPIMLLLFIRKIKV